MGPSILLIFLAVIFSTHCSLSADQETISAEENLSEELHELSERTVLGSPDSSVMDDEEDDDGREYRQNYDLKKCENYKRKCLRLEGICNLQRPQNSKCPQWRNRCERYERSCNRPQPPVTKFNYCSLSTQNTMCKHKPTSYGKSCMKVLPLKMTNADKNLIVSIHNNLRRKVAKGLELSGNPGPQPAAANMREMSWDDELALMAQTHAQQCVFHPDSSRNVARFQVGQNLAIQFSTNEMLKANWASMIQRWYDEVRVMKPPYIKAFPSNPIGVIGHYTQMVWAQSFKIGCGIISYRDTSYQPSYPFKLLYVCNYGVAGNFLGQPIYRTGTAASTCPAPTKARNGLCAVI